MELETKALKAALMQAKKAIGRRQSMPTLRNVLIRAEGGSKGAWIEATDLENFCHILVPGDAFGEKPMLVDLEALSAAVKQAKGPDVTVSLDDAMIDVSSGLTCLRRIPAENVDEYPEPPYLPTARNYVAREALLKAINHVMPCVSTDETRYNLNGIQVKRHREGLRFAATDGHRLAIHHIPDCELDGLEFVGGETKGEIIVPMGFWKSLVPLLKKMDKRADPKFSMDYRMLVAQVGNTTIACRMIEGEYPAVKNVIPETPMKHKLIVSGIEWEGVLSDALPGLKKEGGRGHHPVLFEMGGDDQDECPQISSGDLLPKRHMAVMDIEQGSEPIKLGINPKYLLDAIKGLGGGLINIGIAEPLQREGDEERNDAVLSPIMLTESSVSGLTVVMPLRV